ncbi:hypothetical protein QQS21_002533 [Conoideocrella luteorostrata]|uniref:FAD-binding PCMH-type domain-containing protein n=1 Tax=Conoideocrella luteorostrata TaxID=1105319 RepID=A0AAJ0FWI2_9HYPO|nr:hypothetical protein QQS21_002533 [Conoideocrella luteorostrata]
MPSQVVGAESLNCSSVIPTPDSPLNAVLSRWSESHLSLPAIVITPKTEQDVVAAINLARKNNLKVIPTGGGHGTFVTIGPDSLVLDLKLFDSIQLDKTNGSVRVGGGVQTGDLLRSLAGEGYYTTVPNSNAVGVVGAIIGGGNTSQNGLHGFMVDNVVSFRVVTADGKVVEVHSSSSSSEEVALFDVLRGAGHGLAVVTSAVMTAYPIGSLGLSGDKLWTRTLIFPPPAINDVANAFSSFKAPAEQLNIQIVFFRAPPGTPKPGAPLIVLSASFYGPEPDAEKATSILFDEKLVHKAIKADTALIPLANMNDDTEAQNAHGGYKNMSAARLKSLQPESIVQIFGSWVTATDEIQEAMKSVVIFHGFNPTKLQACGAEISGKGAFLECRDRGFSMFMSPWCMSSGSEAKFRVYVDEALSIVRQADGVRPRTMPNSMGIDDDLAILFDDERLSELARVKKVWDSEGVFWSPYERK